MGSIPGGGTKIPQAMRCGQKKKENKKNKSFYFTFTFSSPVVFFSLCRSKFLTYVIFLLSKELLLIPCKTSLLATNALNFCLSEKVFVSSSLVKDNFTGYRILGYFFLFQHFKYFTPLSSCLHGFRGEVGCNS